MFTLLISTNDTANEIKLFDEVYRHYRKQMIAVAKSILKNDEDAEDAVHDVFCIASSHMDILDWVDNPKDLKNYMLKAVQNRSISILRHQKVCKEYDAKVTNAAEVRCR